MARQDRRHLALDRLKFVIGGGAGEIIEDVGDPIEAAPAALQRLDGVGESWRRGVLRDGVDFGPRFFQGDLEGRAEMRRLDARERRRLERPGPGGEERIFSLSRDCSNIVADVSEPRARRQPPDLATRMIGGARASRQDA